MKRLKHKVVRIVRKSRRVIAVCAIDRARRGLEFMKPGIRLAISF